MADITLRYEELVEILRVVGSSPGLDEFHLEYGDVIIDFRADGSADRGDEVELNMQSQPKANAPYSLKASEELDRVASNLAGAVPSAASQIELPAGAIIVKSPMVGTFYAASQPGAEPFIHVGQKVNAETTICIIEVMKVMNSISARHAGVITEILVKDGQLVEYGQPLIAIDPDS